LTPFEWLSITHDLDLDLVSGHMAYRRVSVIILNVTEIRETFFWTG